MNEETFLSQLFAKCGNFITAPALKLGINEQIPGSFFGAVKRNSKFVVLSYCNSSIKLFSIGYVNAQGHPIQGSGISSVLLRI